jgi:hypothetical protein
MRRLESLDDYEPLRVATVAAARRDGHVVGGPLRVSHTGAAAVERLFGESD